jgi:hypothetical protein
MMLMLAVIVLASSCSELKRDNPYDPSAENYAGITYQGELYVPSDIETKDMTVSGNDVVLGAYKEGTGGCVVKIPALGGSATVFGEEGTGTGKFTGITSIAADASGDIYISDSQPLIQRLSLSGIFSSLPLDYLAGYDETYIAVSGSRIYASNNIDRRICSYDASGGALADSAVLSFTAYGEFVPGRLFASAGYIYAVNSIQKDTIARFDASLNLTGVFKFTAPLMDGAVYQGSMQYLSGKAAYRGDESFNVIQKWGDFGEGPGRILNGRAIAYYAPSMYIYIADGVTIKIFGN